MSNNICFYKNISIFLLFISICFILWKYLNLSIVSYSLWHFLKVHEDEKKKKKRIDDCFNLFRITFIPTCASWHVKIILKFSISFHSFQIFSGIWQKFIEWKKKKKGRRIDTICRNACVHTWSCYFCNYVHIVPPGQVCGAHRLMSLCSQLGDVSNTLPRYLARPRVSSPT